jgi:hypothetical protein
VYLIGHLAGVVSKIHTCVNEYILIKFVIPYHTNRVKTLAVLTIIPAVQTSPSQGKNRWLQKIPFMKVSSQLRVLLMFELLLLF